MEVADSSYDNQEDSKPVLRKSFFDSVGSSLSRNILTLQTENNKQVYWRLQYYNTSMFWKQNCGKNKLYSFRPGNIGTGPSRLTQFLWSLYNP